MAGIPFGKPWRSSPRKTALASIAMAKAASGAPIFISTTAFLSICQETLRISRNPRSLLANFSIIFVTIQPRRFSRAYLISTTHPNATGISSKPSKTTASDERAGFWRKSPLSKSGKRLSEPSKTSFETERFLFGWPTTTPNSITSFWIRKQAKPSPSSTSTQSCLAALFMISGIPFALAPIRLRKMRRTSLRSPSRSPYSKPMSTAISKAAPTLWRRKKSSNCP